MVDVETTTGQVKQAQSVVPPMERLVQGLEKQQADTLKSVFLILLLLPLLLLCMSIMPI